MGVDKKFYTGVLFNGYYDHELKTVTKKVTNKAVRRVENFNDEHMHLQNGIAALLTEDAEYIKLISDYHRICRIKPGLFERYPVRNFDAEKYYVNNSHKFLDSYLFDVTQMDSVSIDEYRGLMFLSPFVPGLAEEIYNYGNANGFVYDDKKPWVGNVSLKDMIVSVPKMFEVIKTSISLKDFDGNGAVDDIIESDKYLSYLRAKRRSEEICYYALMAGKSASVFQLIMFFLSVVSAGLKRKDSSVIMKHFQFLSLEKVKLGWFSKIVVGLSESVFRCFVGYGGSGEVKKALKARFGTHHPFVALAAFKANESDYKNDRSF